MTKFRPRRSVLYMPGSNARALEKARSLPADCLIFDLEDAVAPDAKETARAQVVAALAEGGYGPREIVVRINGLETPWGEADIGAIAPAGADAVLVPKVSTPGDINGAADLLARAAPGAAAALWIMMETPLAMLNAAALAGSATDKSLRLAAMVMGTNDLAKDTRARLTPHRPAMLPWLMTCLAAARAYGLDIIDGVFNDLEDMAGLEQECAQGRDLGMDGKTLIHPKQIDICNDLFAPGEGEISWARKIVSAFEQPENADKGAIRVEGRMVERLHAEMAARTIAIAEAIAERAA